MLKTGGEKNHMNYGWMDGVTKSMISKDLIEEDAEDRELQQTKISLLYNREVLTKKINK